METEDEKLVEKWFKIRNISSGTQKSYVIALKYYVEVTNKTPKELIEEAKEEVSHIVPRKRTVYKYLLEFKNYLDNSKLSPSTEKLYFYAIVSFYKAFDLSIVNNILKCPGDLRLEKNRDNYLTREEICQLITVSPPREKAIIHLAALSGIGQQEVRNLKIKQLLIFAGQAIGNELDDVYDLFLFEEEVLSKFLTIELIRNKNNEKYHIIIPPEASRDIITYLKDRCYGKNEKIRIKNNDDTIFVNTLGNKLSGDSVVTNLRNLGEKAGFKKEKNVYSFWRFQTLRKYFVSTIINKIGKQIIAYYIAGLRIDYKDRNYWNKNPEVLKKHYIEFLPFLSVDNAQIKKT